MTIDLSPFCGTDVFRDYLHKPFSHGEFSYASDGYILVRVPRQPDLPEQAKVAAWDAPFKGLDEATFAPLLHGDLPALPEPTEEECSQCDGRGHEHDCPDCFCTCEVCDGSGKEKVTIDISTTVRGGIFNLKFIAKALSLPGIEFMTNKRSPVAPLLFKFDGGVGVVMPRREKCKDHIEIEKQTA